MDEVLAYSTDDTMDDDDTLHQWAQRELNSATSNHNSPPKGYQRGYGDENSDNDKYTDAVRTMRDRWAIRSVHVNDSSEIIDAIDVEMLDISSDNFVLEIYIILDTNVLLNYLSIIKQTVAIIESESPQLPIFFLVPGIVISELDFQKKSTRAISYDSRRVSEWLAKQIGSAKSRVKGQAYTQTTLPSGDWRQRSGLSNDELIIDCCKYFSNVKRKDVLLCSGDHNLIVQASANATDLFLRGESAVICPSRKSWSAEHLLKGAVPTYVVPTSGPIHARRDGSQEKSNRNRPKEIISTAKPSSAAPRYEYHESHAAMDIDMEEPMIGPSNNPKSVGHYRDEIHQELIQDLELHVRYLTGKVGALQMQRRRTESRFSPLNKFSGTLPSENDWMKNWSVRECLQFIAKIVPPESQGTWRRFGEGEASSLADFLARRGEKGARRGREWAKNDWMREITTLVGLAETFEYAELGENSLAEYEYKLMEVFAIDNNDNDNDI